MMDAECHTLDHGVYIAVHMPNGRTVLSPAEAEQLAADLLRASAAARVYVEPVNEAVGRRIAAGRLTRAKSKHRRGLL